MGTKNKGAKRAVKKASIAAPTPKPVQEPEVVTARRVTKETKVVYNITEITNRGKKTHRQLEVASGSALEADMDAQVAESAGVSDGE